MENNSKPVNINSYLKVVILLTAANLLILSIRNLIVGDSVFNFLKSNLFSGVVPFILAYLLDRFYQRVNTFIFWAITLVWVLFYPNSPYMISDLIHNSADKATVENLVVYDTLIIFSIAMLSIFYGFISIKIMFNLFRRKYNAKVAHLVIFCTIALSCVGFYMGREIKSGIKVGNGYLYSSEIFTHPILVIKAVWAQLFPIADHIPAYLMMILFGVVQYLLIIMFKDINDIESTALITK
jgi:uncharacterized membrane protein